MRAEALELDRRNTSAGGHGEAGRQRDVAGLFQRGPLAFEEGGNGGAGDEAAAVRAEAGGRGGDFGERRAIDF